MREPEFLSDGRQTIVGGPQPHSSDDRRGQQVDVDPANPSSGQAALAHEIRHLLVRDRGDLPHALVIRKEPSAPSGVTGQKLSVDQIVTRDFLAAEQPVQFFDESGLAGEKANPNGCIDENHSTGLSLAAARHVVGCRVRPFEGTQALIGRTAHERLESQANGLGVGSCPGGRLGLPKEFLIDMQGLLHTSDCAISISTL